MMTRNFTVTTAIRTRGSYPAAGCATKAQTFLWWVRTTHNIHTLQIQHTSLLAARLLIAALLVAATLAPTPAWAQDGTARLASGIKAHNAALAGDDASIDEALRQLGPDGWTRPTTALAYHGSALTIEASRAKKENKLLKALELIDSGAKEMDEAVGADPTAIEVRIVRMENSASLIEESPVDRKAQADEDIAFLREAWADLSPINRAFVDLDAGRLALARKKLGEAMGLWRSATLEAPGSEPAGRAQKLLARYGD